MEPNTSCCCTGADIVDFVEGFTGLEKGRGAELPVVGEGDQGSAEFEAAEPATVTEGELFGEAA